ncbi:MAG: peptidylprolyl isomerase [Bacteroidota bacterium]
MVAQVNNNIILKSEIDASVADYMRQAQLAGQPIQFNEDLWYGFLESQIDNFILLEKAKIDSIQISDDDVNRQMDQRIQQLSAQAGGEQALERAFGKSILQLRAEFREQFREQMVTSQVVQLMRQSITITRPEVKDFFESIPKDSLPTIPEQVAVSQIVVVPQARNDAKEAAYDFANQLRDSIVTHNKTIEELAKRHSQGPSGPRGGLLPLMSLNDLVSEYSAAASALKPGDISKVVETSFGFHVIQLVKRIGDQIETRHILIKVDSEQLDDSSAIKKLMVIRDSLVNDNSLEFSELALRNSEDQSTANAGGKMIDPQTGERLIPLNRLDPALYRTILLMDEIGQISDPKPFAPNNGLSEKAYRIIRLDRQIPEHVANFEQDYDRLKAVALQQKQELELQRMLSELRNDIYIDYKIPIPSEQNN